MFGDILDLVVQQGTVVNAPGATLDFNAPARLSANLDNQGAIRAALDGTLTVNLINGFQPNSGDSFQALTFRSGSGTFAAIDGDGPAFTPSFDPTDVTLVAN
jgi:hypothetical protein